MNKIIDILKYTGMCLFLAMPFIFMPGCERNDMYTLAKQLKNRYVATGASGQIWTTTDIDSGTWEDISNGSVSINGAVVTRDSIVVVGGSFPPADSGFIFMSEDALSWTDITPVSGAKSMSRIIYSEGRYSIIGDESGDNQIWVSSNSEDWTYATAPDGVYNTNFNLKDITYGNGIWVIAGGFSSNGETLWSADGSTWNMTSPNCNYLNGAAYGNARFVLVGRSGQIIYSDDNAATWNPLLMGANNLNDVAFGNGLFIAVGVTGTILRSTDGETWDDVSYGSQSYACVTFFNGRFIVAGMAGTVLYSTYGIQWTDVSPGGNDLKSISAAYTSF